MMMEYSVIVPVYNCRDVLQRCIGSVERSGLTDYEILLIDDGSTDGSGELCDQLASRQIRVFHQKNGGVSSARNYGLREARGTYILFVDADDELRPFPMQKISAATAANMDMILFGMDFKYFWKNKLVRTERMCVDEDLILYTEQLPEYFLQLFEINYLSPIWNKFLRRDVLQENNLFFDQGLTNYEDLEFTVRALEYSSTMLVLPESCYDYCNSYLNGHTVGRIAKIPNLLESTDRIGASIEKLNHKLKGKTERAIHDYATLMLRLYLDLISIKLQTSSLAEIRKLCEDFRSDQYVQSCLEKAPALQGVRKQQLAWILSQKSGALKFHTLYMKVRHWTACRVKLLLFVLGVKKSI